MINPSVITLNSLLEGRIYEPISNIVIKTNTHAVHINPLAVTSLPTPHDSTV